MPLIAGDLGNRRFFGFFGAAVSVVFGTTVFIGDVEAAFFFLLDCAFPFRFVDAGALGSMRVPLTRFGGLRALGGLGGGRSSSDPTSSKSRSSKISDAFSFGGLGQGEHIDGISGLSS